MKHLTQRVAWHDRAWNGSVCATPAENSYCLALDRIHEKRDDAYETSVAATPFSELPPEALPPCRGESGAFMSTAAWTRIIEHPYQNLKATEATHGHLRPTPVPVPPFATFAIPFDRMLSARQDEIQEGLPERLPDDQEAPFKNGSAWVFGRRRQEGLLENFFAPVEEENPLVFFYTKEGQPISDSITRLVVGVGRVSRIGRPIEYESEGSRAMPPVWERLVHHTIRPEGSDGFLPALSRLPRADR